MSKDGASPTTFHEKCAGQNASVTVVKTTNGRKFGGYRATSYKKEGSGYESHADSFLFIVKDRMYFYKKLEQYQKYENAHYDHQSYGPCFGFGHDFCINNLKGKKGYANMGFTYKAPTGGYPYYPDSSSSSAFDIADMETFLVEGTA